MKYSDNGATIKSQRGESPFRNRFAKVDALLRSAAKREPGERSGREVRRKRRARKAKTTE